MVAETDGFLRDLKRLQTPIRNKWERCKKMLAEENSTSVKGLGFKRWKPGGPDCYSVRVDLKYRAHLVYDRDRQTWLATEIGDHKALGHG